MSETMATGSWVKEGRERGAGAGTDAYTQRYSEPPYLDEVQDGMDLTWKPLESNVR